MFSRVKTIIICLIFVSFVGIAAAQTGGNDTVTVGNDVVAPKCSATVGMRAVPGFPGSVSYRCSDNSVVSVRAYVTVDGSLVIVPMRKESDGSFTSDVPVSSQSPTFIAFQQERAGRKLTISDNVPYSPACPDALAFLAEKNSAFGPVSERNMRAAVKLGQEIDQLTYIEGALDRLIALGNAKEGM
jgi:hypothetical protein